MAQSSGTQINRNKRNYKIFRKPHQPSRYSWEKQSDRGSAFVSKQNKRVCKSKNIEIQCSPPKRQTCTGAVKRSIQILKNIFIADLLDKIGLTESINQALTVMRFTMHNGHEVNPSGIHHGKKPRTKLTNIIKDSKSCLSDRTTWDVSVPLKQIPIYVVRNEEKELTDHIVKAQKKKIPCCTSHKSPKKGW